MRLFGLWRERSVKRPFRKQIRRLREYVYRFLGFATRCVCAPGSRHAPEVSGAVRNIILLRPDRLGDLILTLPAFGAVRRAYPGAYLTAVVSHSNAAWVKDAAPLDAVCAIAGDSLTEIIGASAVIAQLRELQADLLFAFEPSWACGLLAHLTRAKYRVGWDRCGAGGFYTKAVPYCADVVKRHEIDLGLDLVAAVTGVREPGLPHVPVKQYLRDGVAPLLGTSGEKKLRVLIHPGSRSAYTRWPVSRYAALLDALDARYAPELYVLCGKEEDALVGELIAKSRCRPSVISGLQLMQVAALFQHMDIYIGNATGTTHLAAYVENGPRTLQIIGGTHPLDCPEHWGVRGLRNRIIHKPPIECLGYETEDWVGPEGLAQITVDDVLQAVASVLKEPDA